MPLDLKSPDDEPMRSRRRTLTSAKTTPQSHGMNRPRFQGFASLGRFFAPYAVVFTLPLKFSRACRSADPSASPVKMTLKSSYSI